MNGPLSGIRVLDLSRVLAGPFCTMVLSDLGAEVIKVEAPPQGDDSRSFGPFIAGKSAYFMSLNRGKKSIALDLKQPADRVIFKRLLGRSHVLVENFRPGTMAKLGYPWERLHSEYPGLIYAALSGFGQSGPRTKQPAYDLVIQAMGGIMSVTGHPGLPPVRVGTSIGDIAAGLYTAVGICAALRHLEQTGEGMMVDVAMLDCQVAILENAIARQAAEGRPPGPLGARHPSITPFDLYAAPDGLLVICAGNDELFGRLCQVLERRDLADDERFCSNPLRTENQAALKSEIEAALAGDTRENWLARLSARGVPCGPINDLAGVLAEPQIAARNMLVTSEDPEAGQVRMAGNPIKLSAFGDSQARPPAPNLDQDREEILAQTEP